MIQGRVSEVLISQEQIQERVKELGEEITRDFGAEEIFGICLLKGSLLFTADLIRHIHRPITVDMMRASSYLGTSMSSSTSVKIQLDLDQDISGKNVLVIEDIVDTGRTLNKILALLTFRQPKTLKVCSLLDKPSRRVEEIHIDYCGFTIENHFVVGYGLDYDDYYRNLPFVALLDPKG